jgi:hypothetical protein
MSSTPQILLGHHLKALRLPTFLREYNKLARQSAAEGVDHVRYLLRLAELEMIDREQRNWGAVIGALGATPLAAGEIIDLMHEALAQSPPVPPQVRPDAGRDA